MFRKRRFVPAILACAAAAIVTPTAASAQDAEPQQPASAQDAEPLDGAKLYMERTCIACHGPDARTPILPEYPKIAGQNEAYIVRQIRDIKSGARNNGNTAAMAGVLHLVNDEEIQALAKYISGLSTCP